jgi:hypothetical protein
MKRGFTDHQIDRIIRMFVTQKTGVEEMYVMYT